MPDLRTVLTETLAQHGVATLEHFHTGDVIECVCGWFYERETYAEHLADALLGLPGVAVTQLPEPIGTNGNDNRVWENGPNYIEQEFEGDVIINDRLGIDAEHLRKTAGIFLAAALSVEGNANA